MRQEADGTITYFPLDGPECEVAVCWYLEFPFDAGNVMAMVFRDGPEEAWKYVLRTRMYVDDKKDENSKDRRQGYMARGKDLAELVAKADKILGILKGASGGKLTRLAHYGPVKSFVEVWAKQPWVNARIVPNPKETH